MRMPPALSAERRVRRRWFPTNFEMWSRTGNSCASVRPSTSLGSPRARSQSSRSWRSRAVRPSSARRLARTPRFFQHKGSFHYGVGVRFTAVLGFVPLRCWGSFHSPQPMRVDDQRTAVVALARVDAIASRRSPAHCPPIFRTRRSRSPGTRPVRYRASFRRGRMRRGITC